MDQYSMRQHKLDDGLNGYDGPKRFKSKADDEYANLFDTEAQVNEQIEQIKKTA